MQVTTILVNDVPKVVIRPNDRKDLARFLRNGRSYLTGDAPDAELSHRPADEAEAARWRSAYQLHLAWGGSEEWFFGVPL